jgi:hypothetical protein
MVLSFESVDHPHRGRCFLLRQQHEGRPSFLLVGGGPRGGALSRRLHELAGALEPPLWIDLAVVTAPDEPRVGGLAEVAVEETERAARLGPPAVRFGYVRFEWLPALADEQAESVLRQAQDVAMRRTSVFPWMPPIDVASGRALVEYGAAAGEWTSLPWGAGTVTLLGAARRASPPSLDPDGGIRAILGIYEFLSAAVMVKAPSAQLLCCGGANPSAILAELADGSHDRVFVDVLEVPQSGNSRRLDPAFFDRVHASHYILPSPPSQNDGEAIDAILAARPDDDFTLWPADTGPKWNPGLERLAERASHRRREFRIQTGPIRLVFQ